MDVVGRCSQTSRVLPQVNQRHPGRSRARSLAVSCRAAVSKDKGTISLLRQGIRVMCNMWPMCDGQQGPCMYNARVPT